MQIHSTGVGRIFARSQVVTCLVLWRSGPNYVAGPTRRMIIIMIIISSSSSIRSSSSSSSNTNTNTNANDDNNNNDNNTSTNTNVNISSVISRAIVFTIIMIRQPGLP